MKVFFSLLLLTSLFTACGSQETSDLQGWNRNGQDNKPHNSDHGNDHNKKPQFKLYCDLIVNQWDKPDGLLTGRVVVSVPGKKSYTDTAAAYADAAELMALTIATDQKCSGEGQTKVNIAACSQVRNVNTGNVGRFNTFTINGGLSTGSYQCLLK